MHGYTVDMIDVGQGDAFLVASEGVSCLVDAGSAQGGAEVARHLTRHFGGKLTYALLTHVDDDHIRGLVTVIKSHILPQHVYFNDPRAVFDEVLKKAARGYLQGIEKAAVARQLVEDLHKIDEEEGGHILLASVQTQSRIKALLEKAGIPSGSAFAGLRISLGTHTELRVLSPVEDAFPALVGDFNPRNKSQLRELLEKAAAETAENASSIVVEVRSSNAPNDTALLTGDAGPEVLLSVARRRYSLVKIPHHGSGSTFDPSLLDVWQPKTVALSHGARHGHPSQVWMDALRARRIPVFCSRCHGTVRFRRAGATSEGGWKPIAAGCGCRSA